MADDKRESAKLLVALSSQLIAAKLAMLTMTSAIAIFVLTYKMLAGAALYGFVMLVFGVAMLFVLAIVKGSTGIYKIAKAGAAATWETENAQKSFDSQTRRTFVGLLGLFVLVIIASVADSKQSELASRVAQLETGAGNAMESARALEERLTRQTLALDTLQLRVAAIEKRIPRAKAKR